MRRDKLITVSLAALILGLSTGAGACTTQGPQEQKRASEEQGQGDTTEVILENPEKSMEETADEEETEREQ
jgi:hypothetical protein